MPSSMVLVVMAPAARDDWARRRAMREKPTERKKMHGNTQARRRMKPGESG